MQFYAQMQTAVLSISNLYDCSYTRASQYQATQINNDLTRRREACSPISFCRKRIDMYIHIRCSTEEKRRLKLADSIKMLISPARIVQTLFLFLVFSFASCFSSRTYLRPSRISLMRLLADRVSRARRRELARQSEGDKTGIDSHRQENGTWTTSTSTIASSCAMPSPVTRRVRPG